MLSESGNIITKNEFGTWETPHPDFPEFTRTKKSSDYSGDYLKYLQEINYFLSNLLNETSPESLTNKNLSQEEMDASLEKHKSISQAITQTVSAIRYESAARILGNGKWSHGSEIEIEIEKKLLQDKLQVLNQMLDDAKPTLQDLNIQQNPLLRMDSLKNKKTDGTMLMHHQFIDDGANGFNIEKDYALNETDSLWTASGIENAFEKHESFKTATDHLLDEFMDIA